MVKCSHSKCGKNVTKKLPGLQCGKCGKWMHASCIPITTEQLNALCGTEAVEWKCKACNPQHRNKRISAILPDPEDDDNTDTEPVVVVKDCQLSEEFLRQLRNDVRKAIKDEMERTLAFYSDKIDDFQQRLGEYETKMKNIENQNKDLQNKYTNIQLKYNSMEQKLNHIEQTQMDCKIEICGVEKKENENTTEIAKKVAQAIEVNSDDVMSAYRKERRAPAAQQRVGSSIVVTLKPGQRDQWLSVAKGRTITGLDIGHPEDTRIFLREALTPATAFLLWKAKSELKKDELFKFVWCKGGNVLVRKNEQAKIQTIKSEQDIEKLLKVK
ncbi:uncharacterized protein LOC125235453 [Leguminivora glycinivorella]|uniref:uncharacterized protein LOC125235453 n=1 Tax=Leguminivora glycinivorella TaxID=1035111 RepID=UPI00200F59CD|nr:uncharacterized protein LOC125235453 [Leguminivora glycinivorella]